MARRLVERGVAGDVRAVLIERRREMVARFGLPPHSQPARQLAWLLAGEPVEVAAWEVGINGWDAPQVRVAADGSVTTVERPR